MDLIYWLQLCGSSWAENFHQKIRFAVGPWGFGARASHNILVLLAFHYNVSASIIICDEPNFNHSWLQYTSIEFKIMFNKYFMLLLFQDTSKYQPSWPQILLHLELVLFHMTTNLWIPVYLLWAYNRWSWISCRVNEACIASIWYSNSRWVLIVQWLHENTSTWQGFWLRQASHYLQVQIRRKKHIPHLPEMHKHQCERWKCNQTIKAANFAMQKKASLL